VHTRYRDLPRYGGACLEASAERLERTGRLCMQRLAAALDDRGVCFIVAESRGRADDQRDVDHFFAMRSRQLGANDIRTTRLR
jgi:hypothetical protein